MTTATIRASDAERDQVTRMLQQAVAEGRRWPPEPRWLGPSAHPW